MFYKKKNSRLHRFLCGTLCAGLLLPNLLPATPQSVYAEEIPGLYYEAETGLYYSETTGDVVDPQTYLAETANATPTPTPDPHTQSYYQAPDSNSIEGWPAGPNIEGESAIVLEGTTKAVLYSKNADAKMYPASITKIMTALLGCELLDPNDKIVVSEFAAYSNEPGSSSIYADSGEEFTVHQALMAIMLESANEMCVAMAEKISGSTKKFVELMNAKARALGCTNTHFNNPNGLPDETHYTTASDMAKIARAAWYNPRFRTYATQDIFEIPPTNKFAETRYLRNHHHMLAQHEYAYDGVKGGKTGYTTVAGSTLVTYAVKNGIAVITVVMNSVNGAYSDTASLLDYSFSSFDKINLNYQANQVSTPTLPSEKYLLRDSGNISPLYTTESYYATVPKGCTADMLQKQSKLIKNAAGPTYLLDEFTFNGQVVGWGMQYGKKFLSDLLLYPSL